MRSNELLDTSGRRWVLSGRDWLTDRRLPRRLAALTILLALPSLRAGWALDDHHHRLLLDTPPEFAKRFPDITRSPLDLFTFADGNPENNHRLMDIGFWPWWTWPELRAAFSRPLTAITHWFDYQIWPKSAALMHVHNLAWSGAMVMVVALFYRRIIGSIGVVGWAGLAALLYAIDDARAIPSAWLANRNSLITTLLGVLALIAHDRWRREGWRIGSVVGPVLFGLSLLAKEAGIATFAYLLAHALFLDTGTLRRRVAALAPYVAVVVVWRLWWSAAGYGVSGTSFYVDPLGEPVRWAQALLERAPILLLAQWWVPPSCIYLFAVALGINVLYAVIAAAIITMTALVVYSRLRWDRSTRFWTVGMLFSVVPVCAGFIGDRLLSFVGIGAFALIARFLLTVFGGDERGDSSAPARKPLRVVRALGVTLVVVHFVIAPITLMGRSVSPMGPARFAEDLYVRVPLGPEAAEQTVVVVTAPIPILAGYLCERQALDGAPIPRRTRVLAPFQIEGALIRRPDAHTLVIRPELGFLALPLDALARTADHPMHVGQRVELTGMTAEVLSMNADQKPAEVSFRFEVPLDDPSLRWLHWDQDRYHFVPFNLPSVGGTLRLGSGNTKP